MTKLAITSAVSLVMALWAQSSRAEPIGPPSPDPQRGPLQPVTSDDDPHDEFEAFPLVIPHDKHWARAGAEVGGILALGFVDYLLNTTDRGGQLREGDRRWDLRYAWPDLRGKLVGTAYELDANQMGTNYASHPFAGTMYFHVARSAHLSFAESFLLSVLGSTTWEFFAEIREKVSINDMIVTPAAGTAIGETTLQLSGFFDRGRKNASNAVLSFLFSPVKKVNDWLDGASPRRSPGTDALGLPTEPWHRFELTVGGGATVQASSSRPGAEKMPRATYGDVRAGLDLQVRNLPGYAGAGRHARLFDDGNVSGLSFDLAMSRGDVVDALFATRVVPVGFYYRDASVDPRGRLTGHGAILGMRMSFEYGVHDYDRDRLRPKDLVSVVSPVGIATEHVYDSGSLRVRTSLDVGGAIAGVSPYAWADYLGTRPNADGLPTVTRNHRYYHALGVTAVPAVELSAGAFRLLSQIRLDTFRGIGGLDEDPASVDPRLTLSDRRFAARSVLSFRPADWPARISIGAQRAERAGDIGPASASRSETSAWASLSAVF